MSVPAPTPQDTKRRNLVRIAGLAAVLTLGTAIYSIYNGITTGQTNFYWLAGPYLLLFVLTLTIIVTRNSETPPVGAWHFLVATFIVFVITAAIQPNLGGEIGTSLLVISLVLSIQTLPDNQVIWGAIAGVAASIVTSLLVFYSPFPQILNPAADQVGTWIARPDSMITPLNPFQRFE